MVLLKFANTRKKCNDISFCGWTEKACVSWLSVSKGFSGRHVFHNNMERSHSCEGTSSPLTSYSWFLIFCGLHKFQRSKWAVGTNREGWNTRPIDTHLHAHTVASMMGVYFSHLLFTKHTITCYFSLMKSKFSFLEFYSNFIHKKTKDTKTRKVWDSYSTKQPSSSLFMYCSSQTKMTHCRRFSSFFPSHLQIFLSEPQINILFSYIV